MSRTAAGSSSSRGRKYAEETEQWNGGRRLPQAELPGARRPVRNVAGLRTRNPPRRTPHSNRVGRSLLPYPARWYEQTRVKRSTPAWAPMSTRQPLAGGSAGIDRLPIASQLMPAMSTRTSTAKIRFSSQRHGFVRLRTHSKDDGSFELEAFRSGLGYEWRVARARGREWNETPKVMEQISYSRETEGPS